MKYVGAELFRDDRSVLREHCDEFPIKVRGGGEQ